MRKTLVKIFIVMSFLITCLINSIRVLYMLEYNITEGQIATLKGVFSIVVAMTELPTGVIADKISKKLSLAIGVFCLRSML